MHHPATVYVILTESPLATASVDGNRADAHSVPVVPDLVLLLATKIPRRVAVALILNVAAVTPFEIC